MRENKNNYIIANIIQKEIKLKQKERKKWIPWRFNGWCLRDRNPIIIPNQS